jgi:hypothetical protein
MVESFRGLRKFFNTKSLDAARAKSAKFWIIVHFLGVLRVLCARCPIFGCGAARCWSPTPVYFPTTAAALKNFPVAVLVSGHEAHLSEMQMI